MAIERHILEGEKGFDYRLGVMMISAWTTGGFLCGMAFILED